MEVKGKLYTVNDNEISIGLTKLYYDDIYYVKLPEGSTKFIIKALQRPRNFGYGRSGGIGVSVGGVRLSSGSSYRNSRNSTSMLTTELNVKAEHVQPIEEILKTCIPGVQIEERTVKYSEGRRSFLGMSVLIFFLAVLFIFLGFMAGLPSFLSGVQNLAQSLGPVPILIGAAVLVVLLNIIGFITMDKSKTVKIFTAQRY